MPLLTKYSLKLSATRQFGDIPTAIEMEIGSRRDTILNASLNPTRVDLERTVDKLLDLPLISPQPVSKGKRVFHSQICFPLLLFPLNSRRDTCN